MENSIILADFWGIFMISFSLIFLIRPSALDKLFEFVKDEKFLFTTGFLSFILGLVTILLHNLWTSDWRVLITLFGWFALIKGILRLAHAGVVSTILQSMNVKGIRWLLIVVLLLGIYLIYCAHYLEY